MHSTTTLDNGLGILSNEEYVPKGCGYRHHYKYEIKLNTWGVGSDRVEWLKKNCTGKFGWHFEPTNEQFNDYEDGVHWNDEQAVLSFSNKKEAFLFSLYIK